LIELDHFIIETRILNRAFPRQVERLLKQAEIKGTLSGSNTFGKEGECLEKLMKETEAKAKKLNPRKIPLLVINELGSWWEVEETICCMRLETAIKILRRIVNKK